VYQGSVNSTTIARKMADLLAAALKAKIAKVIA
jgi:hypothetical protein